MGNHAKVAELEDYLAGPVGEDPPDDCEFVWDAFLALNARRPVSSGLGGVVLPPITHESIQEWSKSMGVELTPWEVMAISRLDDLYLDHQRKQARARQPAKK